MLFQPDSRSLEFGLVALRTLPAEDGRARRRGRLPTSARALSRLRTPADFGRWRLNNFPFDLAEPVYTLNLSPEFSKVTVRFWPADCGRLLFALSGLILEDFEITTCRSIFMVYFFLLPTNGFIRADEIRKRKRKKKKEKKEKKMPTFLVLRCFSCEAFCVQQAVKTKSGGARFVERSRARGRCTLAARLPKNVEKFARNTIACAENERRKGGPLESLR